MPKGVQLATNEATVWGIHGGKTGDPDHLFLEGNVVALGWDKVGDLSKIPADREALKPLLVQMYPERKPGAIPVDAGQLYRFMHVMQMGDLVAYPSKRDKLIHIGRVTAGYVHSPSPEPRYPHHRTVQWLTEIPRTHFSQGALYEIGSAMSFFLLKNYADEFVAAAEGRAAQEVPPEDETTALVAEEIEQTTRDYVLKKLAKELKGHPLADFVAHLLECMGYRTRVSPEGPDAGVDIIAHEDELGFKPPLIKVQVKSSESSVGDPTVSQLYGKVGEGEHGLLVALGIFTAQAKAFERSKSNLRLIDGDQLVALILQHYDRFDSRYKGLLPLKRVYVPDESE
jgi:restriction system protein